MKIWTLLFALLFLCSCEGKKSLLDLNLYHFLYRESAPVAVELYDSATVLKLVPASWNLKNYAISTMAELVYAPVAGDSLHIRILEFKTEMSALAFYLNSGLVQERLPVIDGDSRELAMRSGPRLFVFRYGLLRNHERGELEHYVQNFPDYRAGLPPEFLSLPIADRLPGEASIQMKNFLGIESNFPMLVQGFRGNDVYWNAARSWESVSEEDWKNWTFNLQKKTADIFWNADTLFFNAGIESRGAAMRLPDGRLVCLWGALDSKNLLERFRKIAESVYNSPE